MSKKTTKETTAETSHEKSHEKSFTADVEQLIQLVTHSVYSDKEIFLRELISNASDAIQKAKLKSLEDTSYLGDETDLEITLSIDEKQKVITLTDTGIGMNTEEVETNIGTIAKSGTKAFMEALQTAKKNKDEKIPSDLIGQFGIGFYSVFMVADKVELETKSAEDTEATLRISEGKGTYILEKSKKKTRGTTIRIFLKTEDHGFANKDRLKALIKKHANYIPVPIKIDAEQINAMQSPRTKHKRDVKKEEYKEFYQQLTFDTDEPLDTIHIHTEGALSYKTLLFIPQKQNPMAAFQGDNHHEYGPNLYVQNVMIMEKCKELLPVWLRFIKGVVETNDVSLNVSREILQNAPIMHKLQSSLVKETIKSLSRQQKNNPDNYLEFHTNYGRMLKEGVHYDFENKEKIAELVLFYSMQQKKWITLDTYMQGQATRDEEKEKKEGEKKYIYFLAGTSTKELEKSPYLEQFKKNNIDVLLMTDPIDEYVVNSLRTYKEWTLKAASDHDIILGDKEEHKKEEEKIETEIGKNKNFIAFVQSTIGGEKLEKVTFTTKLDQALAIIVTKEGQPSAQMQKMMKAMGNDFPKEKQTLAINIESNLVQKALKIYEKEPNGPWINDFVYYMYEQAILLAGGDIEDMAGFIAKANSLMKE